MGLLWRLSVVVIVLTLLPMQAWGAWVLWTHATARDQSETWTARWGYETEAACGLAATHYNVDVPATLPVERSGNTVTTRFPDGTSTRVSFVCLPDTIDPRGPKGATR